jgi:hypothetical protein
MQQCLIPKKEEKPEEPEIKPEKTEPETKPVGQAKFTEEGGVVTPNEFKEIQHKSKYPKEYCIKQIKEEMMLWDMRCWNEYHNKDEVLEWVRNIDDDCKNCGHTGLCIQVLKLHGTSDDEIAETILTNDKKQFRNVIVKKCWYNPNNCPKFAAQGNYGNDICKECQ